ncbi:MAG: rRNA maturation RNase YbeY [Alphaproteobacteria bacterium]|nr:rRNA maturation RNase YbeY [Alphaproteobacteria bacterium]
MMKHNLNLDIAEAGWLQALTSAETISAEVFTHVLDYISAHETIDFLQTGKPVSVNLCLSNDSEVHILNRNFRGKDKPTNVLSFANIDDDNFDEDCQLNDCIELGDIIIALETMQREAAEQNISLHDHYCHLLTHGLLHLSGYDHMEEDEAQEMESLETAILKQMNIANPYED